MYLNDNPCQVEFKPNCQNKIFGDIKSSITAIIVFVYKAEFNLNYP